ncbi:MAG: hypothetical protein L6Q99_13565 [Planctomycetes bacterium]|nr:hypothetical protein [Planctomycetota bacterium]
MDHLALLALAQTETAATSTGLQPAGWVFMILSVSFVTSLVGWCFYKVLTAPEHES